MTALSRQNTLFVSEDWVRIYEALENVDFRAYDFDNLVQALFNNLRINYPDEYNDWIASSEFISKVEILAWLSQNISFRVDLNTRENFLATAERRDSLLNLANNIAYKVNRVRGASGLVKIQSIRTNQPLRDSNNINLQDRPIIWNDPRNEDWYEQFITVMNSVFSVRTRFGKPLSSYISGSIKTEQYRLRSIAPSNGTYPINAQVNAVNLPFDIYNGNLNQDTGNIDEISPLPDNAFNIFYKVDGRGFLSSETGFFLPIKQGRLQFQDQLFDNSQILRNVDLNVDNINNDDFFVQQINDNGDVIETWSKVDTIFGEGIGFNTSPENPSNVYELNTRMNDRVRVRFGDGAFGAIPVGRFRFWFRTSDPNPIQIKPTSIQNQVITIPYATLDNELFYLTVTISLEDSLTNAASSETDFDIRTRANKIFYTQNRMITAQDYNNFFLRDNSIRKIKTVNRTYSGHSRFSKLNDPTGLYQNVKHVAQDGRFYQDDTVTIDQVSANTDVLTIDELINRYIRPLIRKEDKRLLYYNRYQEIPFTRTYTWRETSIISDQSRGNLLDNNVPIIVGDSATGIPKYVDTDALLRYDGPRGPLVSVDRVVEQGNAPDGIILRTIIPNNSQVISVFPPLRNIFSNQEEINIRFALEQRLNFGLRWDQILQSWIVITFENLDKEGTFSLDHQGDMTGNNLDASWLILLEFIPNGDNDLWRITDRGIGLFFESAREVDFIFSNTDPIVDPETGQVADDSITILGCNESRDSLRRRRLQPFGDVRCDLNAYVYTGDGVTSCFKTSDTLDINFTVVTVNGRYRVYGLDYTISRSPTGDSICFIVPPPLNATIEIRISDRFINAAINVSSFVGDGIQDTFDLGVQHVTANNVISFLDGIMQTSNLDFGIGQVGNNAGLIFNEIIPNNVQSTIFHISGIDSNVFNRSNFIGDGVISSYTIVTPNQNQNTILIAIDGVIQAPSTYTIASTTMNTIITFDNPPPIGTRIRIIAVVNPALARTRQYEFDTNGVNNSFTLSGLNMVPYQNVIVTLDGVLQNGPWHTNSVWRITGNNSVFFPVTPIAGLKLVIFVIEGASGTLCDTITDVDTTPDNQGDVNVRSCYVSFIGQDVPLFIRDVLRTPDGYVNKNGLFVIPADLDRSGFYDNPLIFRDLVILDGTTDLVLWRRVEEFGYDVWDPINSLTSPKGTYGRSTMGYPKAGDMLASNVSNGDIHYDVITRLWLIADTITNTWVIASDQNAYRYRIGRDNLKFLWTHYAPEANRIDPSISNIMNAYLLTSSFDDAFRTWLLTNGREIDRPIELSPEELRVQYSEFNEFKAMSDSIIFYPARYKLLFGSRAIPELRATFKIIQTSGSTITDSDLRLRVLNIINDYFAVGRWDFGETFYFTELCSYIHSLLAPDIQTVVIVPRNNNQAFGRLFQVRAEPDELFISAALPDDIEIVESLTDEELRIGTL